MTREDWKSKGDAYKRAADFIGGQSALLADERDTFQAYMVEAHLLKLAAACFRRAKRLEPL